MERRSVLAGFAAVPLLSVIGEGPVHTLDNLKGAADALGDGNGKLPPARLHRLATYGYADADRFTQIAPAVHRREASETASRLALYAGLFAGNLGNSGEALRYYSHARRHAQAARDTELKAWSYALEARLPLYDPRWLGQSKAPTLVALGKSALGKRKSPVGEELLLNEAIVLARLGDERGATDALFTAARHSEAKGLELRPCPPANLSLISGEVFATLGMSYEANVATREARTVLPASMRNGRTKTFLDDAIVCARDGDMLDATDMAQTALASLSQFQRTAGTLYRARTLSRLTGQRLTAAT